MLVVRNIPGGPVVKTPRFQCREGGFDPWSRNMTHNQKKKKKMLAIIKEGDRNEVKGDLPILFFNV